jgi:putative flippase GtrA
MIIMDDEIKQQPQGQTEFTPRENAFMVAKYWGIAISAGVIQLLVFTLLTEFKFLGDNGTYGINYFIALTISVLWNFTINRHYTFRSVANVPIAMLKVLCYYAIFTPLSILWGIALVDGGMNEYIVLIITMLINGVSEFLFMWFFVLKKTINTNEAGLKIQAEKEMKKNN